MKIFTGLLLALSLIFNWFTDSGDSTAGKSASTPSKYTVQEQAEAPEAPDVPEQPDGAAALSDRPENAGGTRLEDMEYEHYDPEDFYAEVQTLYDLADEGDLPGVCGLYDQLYLEFRYIDSLYVLAELWYTADLSSSYWSEESLYCADLWSQTGDALSSACRYILESPLGDDFTLHIGPESAEVFSSYEAVSDRESELISREQEILNEYYALADTALDEAVYNYQGRDWTWAMLSGYRGDTLYNEDYEGYLEVWYGLDEEVNDLLGPLFLELVEIRAEMAELSGYENYSDYAYELIYGRDFSPEDAQLLCDSVKPIAAEYIDSLYYSDLWYADGEIAPDMDREALLDTMENTLSFFGPELEASFAFMREFDLCVLTDAPSAQGGAYTTELNYYHCPALYIGMENSFYDFSTLTHEFGHFSDTYFTPVPNLLTSTGSYDLFEIHSTGLETLYTEIYDQVFSEGADIARFLTLGYQLESIIDGCIMDEFQRRIYSEPDMTLSEINRLYADICEDYGFYQPYSVDYSWVYIPHNFDAPLYYLSYAVSSLASVQLWNIAQQDMDGAIDTYLAILGQSAYDDGYMQVLQNAGLRLFTEENAVEDICTPLLEYLYDLERDILS